MAEVFDELPAEILELIVGALIYETSKDWEPWRFFPELKKLRLVCKRFAYCQRVLEALFKWVHLDPDPEGYRRVQQSGCLIFAKYVRRVSFLPSRHSTAMTLDSWKEIVTAPKAHDHLEHLAWEWDDQRKLTEAQMPEDSRTSEAAMQLGFEKHLMEANEISALLRSDELRDQWASALRAFSNLHAICFAKWESMVAPHQHNGVHQEFTCFQLAGPIGDLVFAAGVESLAKAGTQTKMLNIQCATTVHFEWDLLPGWQDLDLSRLTFLDFNSEFTSFGDKAVLAMTAILKRCSQSLTHFGVDSLWNLAWPGREVVPLPALREIILCDGYIHPHRFSQWIQHMPSLECLSLSSSHSSTRGYKRLFDAIKDHMSRNQPQSMLVEFYELPVNDWSELDLEQDLVGLGDDIVEFDEATMDEDGDISTVLIRYMAGLSGWDNAATRLWFDLSDTESSDQDSEDTEEDD